MSTATRSFTTSALVAGLGTLVVCAPSALAQRAATHVDPSRPAAAPAWERRVETPSIDVSIQNAPTTKPMTKAQARAKVITPQVVEADVTMVGTTGYTALVLDSDGADNLFIKVQDSNADGLFDDVGFYHGNNGGGWAGITGGAAFFSLAAGDEFSSGHMKVTHDGAGNVTLDLTNLNGASPSLSFSRGGWTPLDGVGYGMGFWTGNERMDDWDVVYSSDASVCDTFQRPNGPLGPAWMTIAGSNFIMGNAASGTSNSLAAYVGDCNGGIQTVEADVSVIGNSSAYTALVLNSDGQDNLYIKLQQQTGGGQFDNVGFYRDVNATGWPGLTGGASFFAIDPADRFSSAHMKVVLYSSGVVRLLITDRDTGGGLLEYQRGGWSIRSGNDAGIGTWTTSGYLDNFAVNGVPVCDTFDRANGPLGPNWLTDVGPIAIDGNRAHGANSNLTRSIFIGACAGVCPSDLNGDGVVNVVDLLRLLGDWGGCP